jgi:hypothetical protein
MPLAAATIATTLSLALSSGPGDAAQAPGPRETSIVRSLVARIATITDRTVSARAGRTFVLVSDLDDELAARTLQHLETTAGAVDRFARSMGCVPRSIEHRLVSVAFGDRDSFEVFAAKVDSIDASWLGGYWMPGADRTVFRRRSDAAQAERSERPRPSGAPVPIFGAQHASTSDDATVAHEAAHQLLHRLGVQRRGPNAPLWISEGLAMAFEGCAAGATDPFSDNPERARHLRLARERGTLPRLASLVAAPSLPSTDPWAIEGFYAASWSLARHLHGEQPTAFAAYLAALRDDAARMTPEHARRLFIAAFGPLDDVERAWRARVDAW